MKYIVSGPTIVNDIIFENGSEIKAIKGGVIYCLAGIKIWEDECLLNSNVGHDFSHYYGEWMEVNACSYEGLNFNLPYTNYNTLKYGEAGLYEETSIYSEKTQKEISLLDHRSAKDIAKQSSEHTKGIYIEASEDDPIWDNLYLIQEKCNPKIMWEIPTSAAMQRERREKVFETIERAGLYSINLPEAMCLFETNDEDSTANAIKMLGVPCFFRVGKKGSYMIYDERISFAPSLTIDNRKVIDVTGCGNVSTAAALYAFCEGYTHKEIAIIANISAAFNLLQFGPYPKITYETRATAMNLLERHKNLSN